MSEITSAPKSLSSAVYAAVTAFLLTLAWPTFAQEAAETPEAEAAPDKSSAMMKLDVDDMSPGMKLPFDGSSTKAFEKSLEAIRAETTEAEFTTVQNALDYLLVYDLAARGDPEVLYKRLDGKTPVEMLLMVNWQTGRRGVRSH